MPTKSSFGSTGKFPTILVSKYIHKGSNVSQLNITINFTGTIKMVVNADGNDNHWEDIGTLVSGEIKNITLSYSGGDIRYKIIGIPGAKIFNTYNDDLSYKAPAIKIDIVQ